MKESNLAVVSRMYNCMAAGDFPGAVECMDRDVRVIEADSLPYGGTWKGHDGFQRLATKIVATWTPVKVVDEMTFHDAGEFVAMRVHFTAKAASTGREFDARIIELAFVENGKVVEMQPFYADAAAMLEAVQE